MNHKHHIGGRTLCSETTISIALCMYVCMYVCIITHIARVGINWVRLPIQLVVSCDEKFRASQDLYGRIFCVMGLMKGLEMQR